nr:MAG TPA: hypothetical protein [Caudoviricetes sp.]
MRKINSFSRIQIMNTDFFYDVWDGDTKDIQRKIVIRKRVQ